MKKILCLVILLMGPVAGTALAVPAPETFADPAMESRARNLQRQLRCLVCQGESIDESGSDLAAELRRVVHTQIAQGRTDQQIRDFLTERYGNFILMKPPVQASTYFLWLAPFLVLIAAGGVAILVIGKARKAAAELPPET